MKKLVFVAFCLLFGAKMLVSQCLSGHFTVGGVSPDFPNVQAAIDTFVARGACDSVWFDIRPGVYVERFETKSSPFSFLKPVILQPDASLPGEVRFTWPASNSAAENFVVRLNQSPAFFLKNLDFERTNAAAQPFSRVVELANAYVTTFDGCRFFGKTYPAPTTDSTQTALVANADGMEFNQIQFKNCRFEGGAWGLFLQSTPPAISGNLKTIDCQFVGQPSGGFFARNQANFEIRRCQFDLGIDETAVALNFQDCNAPIFVSQNRIKTTGDGLRAERFLIPDWQNQFVVAHNFFINPAGRAARITGGAFGTNVTFAWNSLRSKWGLEAGHFVESQAFNNQILIACGNIFDIENGPAMRLLTQKEVDFGLFQSNCFVPKAGQPNIVEQVDAAKTWSFADWKPGFLTRFSVQKTVDFVAPDDLHLAAPDSVLNGRAIFAIYANEFSDIDQEPLSPNWPDIGADQFEAPVANGSIYAFQSTTILPCGQPVAVRFRLKNEGENSTLSTALISWKIDDVAQPDFSWSGSLAVGESDTIELGQVPFQAGAITIFDAELKTINGHEDIYDGYNSATFLAGAGLAGDVTVGFGGDLETIFDLQNRLDQFGICGPTRLLFLPGKFDGPLVLNASLGLSAAKTLEIAPFGGQKGTVFWKSTSFANLRLNQSGHVFMHDIDLISGPSGAVFSELSNQILVENCAFSGPSGGANKPVHGFQTDSMTLRGCSFFYKYAAVYADFFNDFTVENCRFDHDGFDAEAYALSLSSCQRIRIESCDLEGKTFLSVCKNLDFLKNESRAHVNLGSIALVVYGSDSLRISNNNFASIDNGQWPLVSFAECRMLDFVHNSARCKGFGPTFQFSHNAPDLANSVRIENNIFVNDSFGYNYQWYCQPFLLGLISNHNSFHVKGQYFINDFASGISYFDLNGFGGWWTIGQDSMSVLFDPPFFSKTDLRMVGNPPELAGKGLFLPGFSEKDLDGDPRPAGSPDIGADQFDGLKTDISVECNLPDAACHGLPGIFFKLKNEGPDTARRVELRWKINGDATRQPVVWRGKLAAGETTDWLKLGEYFTWDFTANDLEIDAAESRDQDASNNHFEALDFQNRMGGEYTVGDFDGDFRTLAEATAMLENAGVCGPVKLLLRPVLHENVPILPFPGISASQNLTIEPAAASPATVKITGFDNRGASFLRLNRLAFSDGKLTEPATDLQFDGCHFLDLFLDNSPADDGILLKNCVFEGSYIRFGGDPNAQTFDQNVAFENCLFGKNDDEPAAGSGDLTVYNAQNFRMKNCRFERTANPFFQNLKGKIEISENVFGSSPGLTVSLCAGSAAGPMVVANNFFRFRGQAPISPSTLEGSQLDIFSCKNVHFLHNSMLFETTNLPPEKTQAIYYNSSTNCRFENNLVKTGGAAWAFGGWPGASCPSDFNNFDLAAGGFLNGFSSQSEWSGLTGFDQNSTVLPVKFEAENDPTGGSTDLHLSDDSPNIPLTINVLTQISTDFDHEIRGTNETAIGADEPNALPAVGAVWPGDCDDDQEVSTLDWLHLGLAIGQNLVGPARANQSISWSPKFAADWPDSVQNVNGKHADSNGDGLVSTADTAAISLNFGETHSFLGLPIDRSGAVLKIELPAGPFQNGQKVAAPILLGEAVESFYGLAFDLKFSANSIAAGSFWVDFNGSWLGQNGSNSMGFYRKEAVSGRFPVAAVRTDGQNADGFGQIGTLHFEVGPLADSLKMEIVGTHGIQADGSEKPVLPQAIPPVNVLVSTTDFDDETGLEIWPNPTGGDLFLNWKPMGDEVGIDVFDALGRPVFSMKTAENGTAFDLRNWPAGIYELRFLSKNRATARRFLLMEN